MVWNRATQLIQHIWTHVLPVRRYGAYPFPMWYAERQPASRDEDVCEAVCEICIFIKQYLEWGKTFEGKCISVSLLWATVWAISTVCSRCQWSMELLLWHGAFGLAGHLVALIFMDPKLVGGGLRKSWNRRISQRQFNIAWSSHLAEKQSSNQDHCGCVKAAIQLMHLGVWSKAGYLYTDIDLEI